MASVRAASYPPFVAEATHVCRRLSPAYCKPISIAVTIKVLKVVAGLLLLARTGAAQVTPARTALTDTAGLGPLLHRVLATNPDLIAQRRAVEAAAARLRAAGFGPATVLATEVEDVPGGLDVSRAGSIRLALEHEFLSGGRRGAARSLAAAEAEAVAAELDAAEQRTVVLSVQALTRAVDWLSIARRLADQDSLLASAQASLQTRFTAGQARYVDVLRLRTERLRTEAEQAGAETEARVARQGVLSLVGTPDSFPASGTTLVDSLIAARLSSAPTVRAFPPAPGVDSLLVASGAVRLAEAGVVRARADRQLALANGRPRLTAFAGAQRFAGDGGYPVGPVFGGSISLPFTAGQANTMATLAAERGVEAAEAQREATLASRRGALLAARERYEAARSRIAVYDAALLQGARDERESALAAYRSGSLSLIELLDFERALARAEIDRLRSQIDAESALAELLTGGSAPPAGQPLSSPTIPTSSASDAP